MDVRSRPFFLRYAVATISVLVALALTHYMPWLRQRESPVLFFGAVTFSAWYGGRGPGFLACALAAVLINVIIYEPMFSLTLTPDAVIPLLVFMAVAALISSLTTDLARSELQSREHEELLDVTLKSIAEAVICTDSKAQITFANQAAQRLIGLDPKGRKITELFSGEGTTPDGLERIFIRPLNEDVTSEIGGLTRLNVSAKRPLVEGTVAPIKDADNRLKGSVIVVRDVTDRELAKSKILEYQGRLRSMASQHSLDEERGRRVIATGLHDRVGQSLALTRIKLTTLREDIGDPKIARQLDDVTALLRDMLAEIKSLTFELSPPILYELGLEAAVEWLIVNFQKQYNLEISFERQDSAQRRPQVVEIVLFQTARELLTNIVKHAPTARASVKITDGKDNVELIVADTGPTNEQEREGAQERSKAVSANAGNSGFGLFSIRERISFLGGSFALESQQGRGTCVSVSLPTIVAQ